MQVGGQEPHGTRMFVAGLLRHLGALALILGATWLAVRFGELDPDYLSARRTAG